MIARLLSSLALGFGLIAIGGATAPASAQTCPCDFEALAPTDLTERGMQCGQLGLKSSSVLTFRQLRGKGDNWQFAVGSAVPFSGAVCTVTHLSINLKTQRTRIIKRDGTRFEDLSIEEHNACMDALRSFARAHSYDAVVVGPVASANKTPLNGDWDDCPASDASAGKCIISTNMCDPLNSTTEWAEIYAQDEIATLNDYPRDSVYWP